MHQLYRLVLILMVSAVSALVSAAPKIITLGTGDLTGVYYPAGGAICQILNRSIAEHNIRCMVESTQGSAHNLNALYARELDLAIVQGDRLFHAVNGSDSYAESGAHTQLRTLLVLHSEAFTLVARADSGIKTFADLKNKRVNIGNIGSGHRKTMDQLMQIQGWRYKDFALTAELPASEMSQALCDGKIDAFVYMVGHPNTSVKEATSFCDSRIIPLPDTLIETLSRQHPYYQPSQIQGGLYSANPDAISTFKVNAILVANSTLSDLAAYAIVKSLSMNIETLSTLHSALNNLTRRSIQPVQPSLAPVHTGAKRWFYDIKD